jgi:hypothetical protein
MQVDFAVELGPDDETLEIPWAAPHSGPRYYDLKRAPEAIEQIEEATKVPELRDFLVGVNSPKSVLESAKCDAWATTDIHPEEEIFEAPCKFGSYVDLLLSDQSARFSFEDHERLLKRMTELLQRVPEIPASAEFLLRRAYYHENGDSRPGFYVTFYLFGYGADEAKARQQWAVALKLASNAMVQLSSRHS